jgi:hypothetical protein
MPRQLLVGPASLPVTPWKDSTAEMTGTEAGLTKQDGDIQPRARSDNRAENMSPYLGNGALRVLAKIFDRAG